MNLLSNLNNLEKSSDEIIALSHKPEVIQNRLKYPSELEKLNRPKSVVKRERVTPDSVALALTAWEAAIQTNDFSSLSKKTVRILCSKTEVVSSANFIQYLNFSKILSGRMVRLLVPTFQSVWKKQTTHIDLQAVIVEWLDTYQGRNQILNTWKGFKQLLIDDTAEVLLGQEIAGRLLPLKVVSELYFIDTTGGGLFQEVKDIVSKLLTKENHPRRNFQKNSGNTCLRNFSSQRMFRSIACTRWLLN